MRFLQLRASPHHRQLRFTMRFRQCRSQVLLLNPREPKVSCRSVDSPTRSPSNPNPSIGNFWTGLGLHDPPRSRSLHLPLPGPRFSLLDRSAEKPLQRSTHPWQLQLCRFQVWLRCATTARSLHLKRSLLRSLVLPQERGLRLPDLVTTASATIVSVLRRSKTMRMTTFPRPLSRCRSRHQERLSTNSCFEPVWSWRSHLCRFFVL